MNGGKSMSSKLSNGVAHVRRVEKMEGRSGDRRGNWGKADAELKLDRVRWKLDWGVKLWRRKVRFFQGHSLLHVPLSSLKITDARSELTDEISTINYLPQSNWLVNEVGLARLRKGQGMSFQGRGHALLRLLFSQHVPFPRFEKCQKIGKTEKKIFLRSGKK